MRLKVSYVSGVPGTNLVLYHARPDGGHSNPNPETLSLELTRLASRIKLVGKNILGNDLHSVEVEESWQAIDIHVSRGISQGMKKSDFRSFTGWVEIFDTEAGLATRASIPRVN